MRLLINHLNLKSNNMKELLRVLKEAFLVIVLTTLFFLFAILVTPFVALILVGMFVWDLIELLLFGYRLLKDLIY